MNSPVYQSSNYYHHWISLFDADLDNDMDAVWTGLHNFANTYPRMWRNDGNLTFNDVTSAWGITARIPGSGNHGMAGHHADLDEDGDFDFVVDIANGWGARENVYAIYRNNAVENGANWLGVKLVASTSAPNGIGARVEVTVNGKKLAQYMADITGGVRNFSALRFGLGAFGSATVVKVYWPSGQITELQNVEGNRVISVSESTQLPSLRIEEPVGKGLANSAGAKTFGKLLAGTVSTGRVYTIRNTGAGQLTSIALSKVGSHAKDFKVTGPGTIALAPGESTTFSVSFTPTTGGPRTAQISLASNDTNRSPFLVNLAGFGIGFNVDSDKDGLSDAAEFLLKMYASNFDWQVKQPELVGMLFSNVNPAGFFTKAQHDANFVSGRTTGRSDVTGKPTSYNLVSRTNIPPVRVAMPKAVAFAINLGGSWTRYAQSGAPTGWSFDTKTGVLNGLAPASGERSVRIVPYNGSQAGPQMTIQLRPAP